ncbi:MAG: alpha/beta hydrolase [Pseudomonadota bacterium]
MIWLLVLLAIVAAAPFVIEVLRPKVTDETRAQGEGQSATLSQGVTHYEWIGPLRGPVAVCVHGLTTPSFVWTGLAHGLAAWGYRVLIYDLYGRGLSDRPGGRQNRAFFITQLNDLLDHEEVKTDITLFGYSMGSAVATAYAAAHPDRIRRLILLAPAGMQRPQGILVRFIREVPLVGDWLFLTLFSNQHRRAVDAERDLPASVPDIYDRTAAELKWRGFAPAVLSSLRGMLSEDLEADHRGFRAQDVPVVAIWGEADALIPLSAMGRLTEWSRHARQEVIPDAGHGLLYTHTDEILAALRSTLADDPD